MYKGRKNQAEKKGNNKDWGGIKRKARQRLSSIQGDALQSDPLFPRKAGRPGKSRAQRRS